VYRIGVDIGGTFTDFTVVDEQGEIVVWKEPTTPAEPSLAIKNGLEAIAANVGQQPGDFLRQTSLFVHGTTIATNTVIQRNGPAIGLLATKGFRDVLYLRDGFKPDRFNIRMQHPQEFVERSRRIGITERIDKHGNILTPLAEDEVQQAAARFSRLGVSAVAVAYLWAIANPAHEQRTAEILASELPGVHVVCGSDVLPEIREWERTSATALSAYILPGIDAYLRALEELLVGLGLPRQPLIMQINGGCASVAEILRRPVYALASGPAAAPAAASAYAGRVGLDNLITVDMGGTSFDVCLIRGGRPTISRSIQVESQPVGVAGIDVHSIGAGGGSIAWVDSGGALRVGPRSAGAVPGPACYGAGGTEPTVTDANVVLGYLAPEAFLGGRRTLRDDLARSAILTNVAEPLQLTGLEAAAGIIRVVNANMVQAIRAVSVERGIDPRGYTLVVGGGAGGLHAAQLARELGIARVLIPREAGVFCAFGMTVTDVRHDYVRAFHSLSSSTNLAELDQLFAEIEDEARVRLRGDGFDADQIVLERSVDARYPGQVHELTVSVPSATTISNDDIRTIERAFHEEHKLRFTYSRPELPVEFLHWRVSGVGRMPVVEHLETATDVSGEELADAARLGSREAWIDGQGMVPVEVYDADRLHAGASIAGPAILQSPTTTILLGPGDELSVGSDGSLELVVTLVQTAVVR
jgi:N-methylhydantoinase A